MSVHDPRFHELLGAGASLITAIFDALPDAIGVMWPIRDDTGAVVDFELGYTNPSAETLMGVPLSSHQGASLHETMPGLVPLGIYDRLIAVTETGEADSAEVELDLMWRDAIHVRGVWVHTVLPFGAGVMSVAFDVTEERRRERELRDFAAVAAHDLREPLISMRLMAGVLSRREGLGAKEQELVRVLDGGSDRALALVDSILEYATAERDAASRSDVDCGAVVADVLATLAPQIDEVEAQVEVGDLPQLRASRDGLARVFQNLIANALKFCGEDVPRLRISASPQEDGWAFAVRDNGVGLPEGSGIFEMFSRGSGAHEGSGVGLATCRRIVEGHGGRIWAEPAPGGGSTFSFTVPGQAA